MLYERIDVLFAQQNVKKFIFLAQLLSLFIDRYSYGAITCGHPSSEVTPPVMECIVQDLIEKSFPELITALSAGRIRFREFHSDSYFLKTSILNGVLSKSAKRKVYSIDINSMLYKQNQFSNGKPTVYAITGILAHELIHLADYEMGSVSSMASIGIQEFIFPSRYERYTDRRAFERGYALELKAYREWLYPNLTKKELRRKMRRYYTPSEIDDWILKNPSNPSSNS